MKVYDKLKWHFPDGNACPNLEAAKKHFVIIMKWLYSKSLLSQEGIEAMDIGIDQDFSLTSSMLTAQGNELLTSCYAAWLKTQNYKDESSIALLEQKFNEMS